MAAQDVIHLLNGGVDGILFYNEDDRPDSFKADFGAGVVVSRVITELRPRDVPFGVDFLWDARAPLAVVTATGAAFIREVVTGVYESDMGLWSPDPAAIYRRFAPYKRSPIQNSPLSPFDNFDNGEWRGFKRHGRTH